MNPTRRPEGRRVGPRVYRAPQGPKDRGLDKALAVVYAEKKEGGVMDLLRKAVCGFCCLMIALGVSGLAVLGISCLAS